MCGRYVLYAAPQKLKDLFGTENIPNFPPRYNAAPLQDMPLIIRTRMGIGRWGFLPPWSSGADDKEERALASKMINARSETVMEKPSFREAWAKGRRCLIPANGFYEWRKENETGVNQPYYIHRHDGAVTSFAGLWSKVGDVVSFTLLTKDADGAIADLHHRMPVMIPPENAADWFAADGIEARKIIARASGTDMTYHAVGTDVGKVANDDESLIGEIKVLRQAALQI